MTIEEKFADAIEAIKESSLSSSIYVGCDSQKFKIKGKKGNPDRVVAKYSTVIIVHMDSKHGSKIFHNTITMPDYGNMRQRLMAEVGYAIETALAIVDHVGDRHFEVHLDLNSDPRHRSNVAVKEAIGYVTGTLGFPPKIKPDAFAATHCSDHAVRSKFKVKVDA